MDKPEAGKKRLPLYGSIGRFSASGGSTSRLPQSTYYDFQVALESLQSTKINEFLKHVWSPYENQMVRLGCYFLFYDLVR